MRFFLVLASVILAAKSAIAGDITLYECNITRECIAGETCGATQFELLAEKTTGSPLPFKFFTSSQTIDGIALQRDEDSNEAAMLMAGDSSAAYMLSVDKDGNGQWSVHLTQAGMAITYFGKCLAG